MNLSVAVDKNSTKSHRQSGVASLDGVLVISMSHNHMGIDTAEPQRRNIVTHRARFNV